MKSMKRLAVALSALGLLSAAAPGFATPTLTFVDGASTYTVDPFGGFDWQSNATAVSTTPVFDGTTISTTTYLASATEVKLAGGADSGLAGLATDYEFTVKATIYETQTCAAWSGVPFASTCLLAVFTAVGGTFDIYYDSVADSNIVTGTGFLDGTNIISGTILPGIAGTFTVTSATAGIGVFSFDGDVSFTNVDSTDDAYFSPALDASNAVATLQIGGTTTDWTAPTSWVDGGGFPNNPIVFQADGNQTFTAAVPEPASLALVGLSLMGLAATRRRRGK
jgi:hypothetical protein